MRVIAIGDNYIDHYIERSVSYPGGNAINFAVYATMLGHSAAYCGVIADDSDSQLIIKALDQFQIDYTYCQRSVGGETGRGSIFLENGDRNIKEENDNGSVKHSPLQISNLILEYIRGFDLIHMSCNGFLDNQIPRISSMDIPIVYDFSDTWDRTQLRSICPFVTICLLSGSGREENELKAVLSDCLSYGCEISIATSGSKGAIICTKDYTFDAKPFLAKTVFLDTMGAGDAFLAGFSTTFIEGVNRINQLKIRNVIRIEDWEKYYKSLIMTSAFTANVAAMKACCSEGSFGMGK